MALRYFIDRDTRLLHRYPPLCDVEYRGQLVHIGVPGKGAGWEEWCPVCKGTKGENLSDIGETFFSAITSIFDALISAATGGILKDFWSSLTEGEEFLDIVSESLHDHVIDLIGNTESTILAAASRLENEVAREFAELLGVTDFQRRLAESLQAEIEAITAKWEKETEVVAVAEAEAAISLAEKSVQILADRQEFYQNQSELYMGRLVELVELDERHQLETSISGIETAQSMLDIDLALIHDQAAERNVESVATVVSEVDQEIETAKEWLLETAVKPLAYGEMGMRVLADMLETTPEDVREQIRMIVQQTYAVSAETIPEFKKGPP